METARECLAPREKRERKMLRTRERKNKSLDPSEKENIMVVAET